MVPLVRLPPLDLIKGFVAVARRMSVTQAADDLCLTQSAISKQLRALEDHLGVPLFQRGFRSLMLTQHGHMLLRVADESILHLQQTLALMGPPQRRPVAITASTGVAGLWLLPRIGEFQRNHPLIDVRLIASNSILDLGQDLDLAIRYCAEKQAPLGAIKLFGDTIVPVANVNLPVNLIKSQEDLANLTLLEFDMSGRPWLHWAEWLSFHGWNPSMARGVLRFNQYEQMIQAAIAGQGVALGRLELLRPLMRNCQLKVVEFERKAESSDFCYWLIQADKNPSQDVRHVVEWVLESAAAVIADGEGWITPSS